MACGATWGKCEGLQPLYEGLELGGSGGYLVAMEWTVSTGDLRILPDLSTFYGRKVGKFTAVN